MTTETLPNDSEQQSAASRPSWFTSSQWRGLRIALMSVLIGAVGVVAAWVGVLTGVSHSLAMKVEWNAFYYLSWILPQRLFERCLIGLPTVIASLGIVMLTIIVVPALYRRLPPRPRRVAKLIGMMTRFILIAVFVYFVGIRVIKKMWSGAAEPQSPQAPFLRQQFSSFMDRNGDWIIPMAYLIVVCLLAVIAWTLIALLRRQSPPLPPSERKQDL